jgi:hypothetical protein
MKKILIDASNSPHPVSSISNGGASTAKINANIHFSYKILTSQWI